MSLLGKQKTTRFLRNIPKAYHIQTTNLVNQQTHTGIVDGCAGL